MNLPLSVLAAAAAASPAAREMLARDASPAARAHLAGLAADDEVRAWLETHPDAECRAILVANEIARPRARGRLLRDAQCDPRILRSLAAALLSDHPVAEERWAATARARLVADGILELSTLPALLALAEDEFSSRDLLLPRLAELARSEPTRAQEILDYVRSPRWRSRLVHHLGPWDHCDLDAHELQRCARGRVGRLLIYLLPQLEEHLGGPLKDAASPSALESERVALLAALPGDLSLRTSLASRALAALSSLELDDARRGALILQARLAAEGVTLDRTETLGSLSPMRAHDLHLRTLAHLVCEGEWDGPPADAQFRIAWCADAFLRGDERVAPVLTALIEEESCPNEARDLAARVVTDLELPWELLSPLAEALGEEVDDDIDLLPATLEGDARFVEIATLVPYVCDEDDLWARRRPASTARALMHALNDRLREAPGEEHTRRAVLVCAGVVTLRHQEVLALPWVDHTHPLHERIGQALARELTTPRSWEVLAGLAPSFEGSVGELVETVRGVLG